MCGAQQKHCWEEIYSIKFIPQKIVVLNQQSSSNIKIQEKEQQINPKSKRETLKVIFKISNTESRKQQRKSMKQRTDYLKHN